MAHYAYKHACYDIDYEKYKELVARFEKEQGCEHNGDSNYDGDNWYIVAMWIEELRADLVAAQATIAEMREALGNLLCRAETEYQALTDGEHGNFFEFPEAKFATATYHTTNLDALQELRALECERLAEVCLLDVDEPPNTGHEPKWLFSDGRSACVDRLREEAAAHRAKKGEGKC